MKKIRIGGGAGFSGDRIPPAVELVESGDIDYIVFECLAERTIMLAQQRRRLDPSKGYDPLFERRMRAILESCAKKKIKIITNMGAANPRAAGELAVHLMQEMEIDNLVVAVVTGDDILDEVKRGDLQLHELELSSQEIKEKLVSANIYLGSCPILEALRQGADVVITGRIADPSLFVAPLLYEFGWANDDWNRVGRAVMLGHLMECGCQISGGYYADPGYKDVEKLARLGYPILEVYEDERAYITKVPGSGGQVSVGTCKEQLLYEVRDPSSLITPDAVSDLTDVRFTQVGPDRVQVFGGKGRSHPVRLRVLLCVHEGYIGEGEISYGGLGAYERAQLAATCVHEWLESECVELSELRVDFIGVNHLYQGDSLSLHSPPSEIRLRISGRAGTRSHAERVGEEVESLFLNGPAAGGGARKYVREVTPMYTAFVDRKAVRTKIEMLTPN